MIDTGQVQRILRVGSTTDVGEVVTASQSIIDGITTTYSAEKRDLIGAWIAAHFYSPETLLRKKVGDVENQFAAPKMGSGLSSSKYGRTALTLDDGGFFSGIGKRAPKMEALGPVEPNSTDTGY